MITNIRNFTIIAHIDHGKSTLADRMLEITGTIEKRNMKNQLLDNMELERERGITIKMTPVRMMYELDNERYTLNLIDTPGHIDFSYEVSRALKAVEGAVLLVDSTQGIQAQTLTVLEMARSLRLPIIPVVSKIDLPSARVDEIKKEIAGMCECDKEEVLGVSGKTGEGVVELLAAISRRVPPPRANAQSNLPRALVFDFEYSEHRGVIVYIRVMDGSIKTKDRLLFVAAGVSFQANEVGVFSPEKTKTDSLSAGEIGYIVTGIKTARVVSVGDTVVNAARPTVAIEGYKQPSPVVWASVYPESQDDFGELKMALERLRLSDSSLSYEEESSGALGRGFRLGLLGMLHLEIVVERLKREFGLVLIVTSPTIVYEITYAGGLAETVYSPSQFPDHGAYESVSEPWVSVIVITPSLYMGGIMGLLHEHEAEIGHSETFGDGRVSIQAKMPLRELMRNFFDELKSISSGFASLSYEKSGYRDADVARLDVVVADEIIPAFSKVVAKRIIEDEAKKIVERLYDILPRQLFVVKIQAKALGKIISSKTLSALRKDVTGYLYGGDVTRKKKLLEKQKKGKKKRAVHGKVSIPHEVFLKMMKGK